VCVALLWMSQVAVAADLPPSTDLRVQAGPRDVYTWLSYTRGLREEGIDVSFEGVNAPANASVTEFRGHTVFVSMAGNDNPLDLVVKPLRTSAAIDLHLEHLAGALAEATGCEVMTDPPLNNKPIRVARPARPARDVLVDLIEADGRRLSWVLTRSTTTPCFAVLSLVKTWTPREPTSTPTLHAGNEGRDGTH
jgi:hypothetical protein